MTTTKTRTKTTETKSTKRTSPTRTPESQPIGFSPADLLDGSLGHASATPQVSTEVEHLISSFQSNLLSLVSHELRTPLTGILNALRIIDSGEANGETGDFSKGQLVQMALKNAERLNHALGSLLDLAQIENGSFRVRLREVDLARLCELRLKHLIPTLARRGIELSLETETDEKDVAVALADAQKMGSALEHLFRVIAPKLRDGETVDLRAAHRGYQIEFTLAPGTEAAWDAQWLQGAAGSDGRVLAPGAAFAGALAPESRFLTREGEGLGAELVIVHEIMRAHGGAFLGTREGEHVALALELPRHTHRELLASVLRSRIEEAQLEQGGTRSVALSLFEVPRSVLAEDFVAAVRRSLFRASDAAYAIPDRRMVAVVLDDCKVADVPKLVARIEAALGIKVRSSVATAPEDSTLSVELVTLAESRLAETASSNPSAATPGAPPQAPLAA